MIPDRTTLFVLIASLLLIFPAQRILSVRIKAEKLAIEKQKCEELIEMLEAKGIEGFRWNGESCGKCYPEQFWQGKCEL